MFSLYRDKTKRKTPPKKEAPQPTWNGTAQSECFVNYLCEHTLGILFQFINIQLPTLLPSKKKKNLKTPTTKTHKPAKTHYSFLSPHTKGGHKTEVYPLLWHLFLALNQLLCLIVLQSTLPVSSLTGRMAADQHQGLGFILGPSGQVLEAAICWRQTCPHRLRARQLFGFATQIPTADHMLESLRGVAWLLAKLRRGRTWAEGGRKMPVFDMKAYDATVFFYASCWGSIWVQSSCHMS